MARTQADREFDWSTGREMERKDAEIAHLRAENDRLRAALQAIVNKDRTGFGRAALGFIARHALTSR